MTDKTDFILYGGIAAAVILIAFLGYRIFRKKAGNEPKNVVMNKIQDFYSLQDNQKNKPDTNY